MTKLQGLGFSYYYRGKPDIYMVQQFTCSLSKSGGQKGLHFKVLHAPFRVGGDFARSPCHQTNQSLGAGGACGVSSRPARGSAFKVNHQLLLNWRLTKLGAPLQGGGREGETSRTPLLLGPH